MCSLFFNYLQDRTKDLAFISPEFWPTQDWGCVSASLCVSVPVAHAESWTLTLFLTPNCSRNADAVRDVAAFVRRHPEVQGSGVLLVEWHDLGAVLPHAQDLFR